VMGGLGEDGSNGGNPANPADPLGDNTSPKGRWASFIEFGETKIGSAIVTLVLTGVVGAFLTNYFTDIEKHRDRAVAASELASTRRHDYIAFVGKIISDRRVAVSLMHSALVRPTFPNEVERRWQSYQEAYAAYNRNSFSAYMDFLEFGRRFTKVNLFGDVLDRSITPSFRRLDSCLTTAVDHRALIAAKTRRDVAMAGSQTAHNDFQSCGKDKSGKLWSYDQESRKLDRCIHDYQYELEWAVVTTDKAADQTSFLTRRNWDARRLGHWVHQRFDKKLHSLIQDDWLHAEPLFWAKVPGILHKACDPLMNENYAPEPPT
jgi:hypothetical protein